LLATAGTDYALSGYRWANPAHVTYSIAPDGTPWGGGTNALNATFDAELGASWRREVARALATWESVANINIGQVPDSGASYNATGLPQGDPRFGDIRFGGYAFPNNTTTLAMTNYPYGSVTQAGDIQVNTALGFGIGPDYDLYTVLLHETGHALGLSHAANPAEVMFEDYHGVVSGLAPGDVAGIQAIYGPRVPDAYQQQGQGLGLASAIDLSGALGGSQQATPAAPTELATIGDTEYFTVVAPAGAGPTLQVTAQVAGLSLLSPRVSILDASGAPLDVEGNAAAWGDDVSAQVGQVVPGQRYYIAVTGATGDVFAVGAYQLNVTFVGGAPAASQAPPPPIGTPSPAAAIAPDRFEPNDTPARATRLGLVSATAVGGLTLDTPGDVDVFSFQTARAGTFQVTAPGTTVRVLNASGSTIAVGAGQVTVAASRARTTLYVQITSPDGRAVSGYGLTIGLKTPTNAAASRGHAVTIHPKPSPVHVARLAALLRHRR
jgi:hypothetical protein